MRAITWISDGGAEFALADVSPAADVSGGLLCATGVAIGADPLPYRLDYELDCGDGYVTRWLSARAQGTRWQRKLELSRDPDGGWTVEASAEGDPGLPLPPPGGDPASFGEALDCDLGLSPLTNTMPVLRHGLLDGGGPADCVMAWVSVPDLAVRPSAQSYAFVRREAAERSVIRFRSGEFTADVVFDSEGLVVDYPGIGRRADSPGRPGR